jgi:uncharacterized protein (DUF1778 family)
MTAKAQPRVARLEARISEDQKALFARAARLQGRSLSDFVVASVHEAAVRAIADMQAITLDETASRAFAEALLNPGEPAERLAAAARRHRAALNG